MSTRLNSKRALAAAVCAALVVPAAAAAHPPSKDRPERPTPGELRKVFGATKKFRDVKVAERAGYEKASECEKDPKYGAMGFHYANADLLADGKLDIERPEILVYQPTRSGKLRLGAVEYFQVDADQNLHTFEDRPSLFDLPFDGPMLGHNPQMPIHYDLHVWLYRHNPAGMFAAWNPNVRCP
ncbi:MAG TPA: hypothetical protein VFZ00_22550 [Solirubrobacter sp.]|nr:hypothetical protein [Solirubrobacter sp.]